MLRVAPARERLLGAFFAVYMSYGARRTRVRAMMSERDSVL